MSSLEKTTETASPSSPTTRTPAPAPALRVKPPAATFQPPTSDQPTPSTSDPGGLSAIGWPADPLDGRIDTHYTGTDEAPAGGPVKLNKTSLAEITRKAVFVASQYVHTLLARDPEEVAQDVWIANEREQKDMGDPLAGILARNAGKAEVAADLADLVIAGVGLLAYVANHAARAWSIRRGRRKLQLADPIRPTGDTPQ